MARLAMTSLAFMFDWVPDPVCHTKSGKWSSRRPSMTSSAAATITSAFSLGSAPSSRFTSAQAFFSMPNARTTWTGIGSSPIEK
jgi:hypothetical protein